MIIRRSLILLVISFFIAFSACNNPFPEYTEVEDDLYMKLLSFEESDASYRDAKYVVADVKILSGEETVFRQFKEQLFLPKSKLSFLFNHLNAGDSAVFKINNNLLSIYFSELSIEKDEEQYLTCYVKVYEYLAQPNKIEDVEMYERILMNKYLKEGDYQTHHNGIFVQQLEKGSGESIKRGKVITIHYKGKFLNQVEFDNTYKKSSFTFTYGTPGQVIEGIEIALKGMSKGEKSKIIIPSQLAFGEEGSSTQIVPPYTAVQYELEIINVK